MKKLKIFFLTLLCAIAFGGCELFENTASITISLDTDALRQALNENMSLPSKGTPGQAFPGHVFDNLSLRIVINGDEEKEVIVNNINEHSSKVSASVDGLKTGATIKVRVDLINTTNVQGSPSSTTLISGGTKWFKLSTGEHHVPIQMGNYTDIIVWDKSNNLPFCRILNEEAVYAKAETENIISETNSNMAYDSVTNALNVVTFGSGTTNWYGGSSWNKGSLDSKDTLTGAGYTTAPRIAVNNGILYHWSGNSDIIKYYTNSPAFQLEYSTTGYIADYYRVKCLAFSPDGTKAYLVFYYEITNVEAYYLMSLDVIDGILKSNTNSIVKIADLTGYAPGPAPLFSDNIDFNFYVTDIRVQDGYVWILVKQYHDYSPPYFNRGALIRFNLSLTNPKVFGWTSNAFDYYGTPKYAPASKNSKDFFGPIKFIAIRPGELVIADDGNSKDNTRVIFFDTEKEMVTGAKIFYRTINYSDPTSSNPFAFDN